MDGVGIAVARLADILESKHRAGRKKDLLFLETYREALGQCCRAIQEEVPGARIRENVAQDPARAGS